MPGKAPSPWAKTLAQGIGARVKHYREAQGMTGRALSARCTDLGLEIRPAVLSTIETGVRDSITAAELLVLAAALRVPVVSLLLPIGTAETTEIIPGVEVGTDKALTWVDGGYPYVEEHRDIDGDPTAFEAACRMRGHAQIVRTALGWRRLLDEHPGRKEFEKPWDKVCQDLRNQRRSMRAYGEVLPPVPDVLAHVDDLPDVDLSPGEQAFMYLPEPVATPPGQANGGDV